MPRLPLDKRRPLILVGSITDNRKLYVRDRFVKSINNLTYPHDFYLFDTENLFGSDIEIITKARNKVREVFLKGNYDYLLSVDSDVIIPNYSIEKLLSAKKEIISFKVHFVKNGVEIPAAFKFRYDKGVKIYTWSQLNRPRILRVWGGSLAISLISRKVLEKVPYRCPNINYGEDYWFMRDLENRFAWFLDTSVRVNHVQEPI